MSNKELDPGPEFISESKLSRRDFLKLTGKAGLVIGAALAVEEAPFVISAITEQLHDWDQAGLSNDDFIGVNKDRISNLNLGASFRPEEFQLSLDSLDAQSSRKNMQTAVKALHFAVEDLGINNIRLGIRWNNVIDRNGNFNFEVYEPFFSYLVEKDVDICLSLGIKTPGDPEDHVARAVSKRIRMPSKKSVIIPGSDLANESLEHTNAVFDHIAEIYGPEGFLRIKTVQTENEPFDAFGQNQWTMGQQYLLDQIRLSSTVLPHADILINTVNPLNFKAISQTFELIRQTEPNIGGRLVLGHDYYPFHPGLPSIPSRRDQKMDLITLAGMGELYFGGDLYKDSLKSFNRKEVTEGQAEPWAPLEEPGNSAQAFRFMAQRSMHHLLDPNVRSTLRIWGVEYMAKKFITGTATDEHRKIVDFVQKVNSQKAA